MPLRTIGLGRILRTVSIKSAEAAHPTADEATDLASFNIAKAGWHYRLFEKSRVCCVSAVRVVESTSDLKSCKSQVRTLQRAPSAPGKSLGQSSESLRIVQLTLRHDSMTVLAARLVQGRPGGRSYGAARQSTNLNYYAVPRRHSTPGFRKLRRVESPGQPIGGGPAPRLCPRQEPRYVSTNSTVSR